MNRRAWLSISILFMIVVNSGIGSDANQVGGSSSSAYGGPVIRSAPYTGPVIKAPQGKYNTELDKDVAGIGRTVIDVLTTPILKGLKVVSDPTFPACLTGLGIGVPLASTGNPLAVAAGTGTIVVSCGPAFSKALEPGPSLGEAFEKAYLDSHTKSYSEENPQNANTLNKDLGGINFTSIKINYISVSTDQEGGVNFDIILKAQKANGASLEIDPINSTLIGATTFIAGLAVPNDKFWVSLSPWEPDRIIDQQLSESEVGRILLEADLQMKKDVCNYCNPCANETGEAYWDLFESKREELAQQCMNKYPGEIRNTDNVYFRPVLTHWIIPDKIYAYTDDSEIYIINYTLTINSESDIDHSTFELYNQDAGALSRGCFEELNRSAKEFSQYTKELDDSMILPYVISDVNHADRYEDLRNVFVALGLAQWYKSKITPDMDIFRDIYSSDYTVSDALQPWSFQEIWEDYIYSYENGEYICWENTTTKTATGTRTRCNPRSRGGVTFRNIDSKIIKIEGMPSEVQDRVNSAVLEGFVDEEDEVLFGNRFHENRSKNAPVSESGSGPVPTVTEAAHDSNESIIDDEKGYDDEVAPVTCPEGWMGPDENGECWKMQILS